MPDYSFILVCNNQWKFTVQAITTLNESLSPSLKKKGVELLVINNGSMDETKIGVEQLKEDLRDEIEVVPIHLNENMGYLIGTTIGFSKARGKIITLLNNDLIFPENWFDGIARTLEENPSVGAAAPFLSYAAGPAGVGVWFESLREIKDFGKKFMEDNKNKIVFTEATIGACISIKRELFSLIGGNDYWFGLGWGEDIDFSFRICIAGYKIAIVGASFVYHVGNATIGQHGALVTAALKSNDYKINNKWDLYSGLDRKTIIENTVFSKDKHTFPCRIEDFNPPSPKSNQETITLKKKIILVADWNNECSQWRNKLADAKKMTQNENHSLTIWIPKTYYPEDKIKIDVSKLLGENQTNIHYYSDVVPPIDLLKFFNDYDVFLTVQDDFVNLYFNYLLENSTLDIKAE